MEALVGLGVLGAIPLVYVIFRTTVWCFRRLPVRTDAPYAILIVPLLLHTLVSLGLAGWLNADFVIFACLAAMGDTERRARSRRRALHDGRATHLAPERFARASSTAAVDR